MTTKSISAAWKTARAAGWAVVLMGVVSCEEPAGEAVRERATVGIVRTGDEVRLTGIGALRGWGEGRDCTLMHSLEVVLSSLGREIDYDELMGLSGMAFRTQFRQGFWDSSDPEPLTGEDCVKPLMPAIGMTCETYFPARDDVTEMARTSQAIVASIDYGIPVLATNLIPPENWGIITGYRYKGQQWWCRTYDRMPRNVDAVATHRPTAILVLGKAGRRPDAREAHRASVGRAVQLHEMGESVGFAQGKRAFDEWCGMLERAADRDYLQANAWTYVSLIDARGAAARYLRRIAGEFGGNRVHIEKAAEQYAKERQVLMTGMQYVSWPRDVPRGVPSFSVRERQIAALREAAAVEAEAVAALRRAR